ncbi:hypothetical protein Q3G72_019479 [Acer saccharum]|nr:hypothetical protein Q3G72_019479 [Acer saccharum]
MTTAIQGGNRTQLQVVKQFRRLHPSSFEGTTNLLDAEEWLLELEKMFTFINCTNEQKVACAVFMLKGDAGHWCEMTNRAHNVPNSPITWFRKSTGSSAALIATEKQIIWDLKNFNIEVVNARSEGFLGMIVVQPTLIKRIKEEQFGDVHLRKIKEDVATGKRVGFSVSNDGVLWFEGRLCVPSNVDFKNGILSEMHKSLYSVHP